MTLDLERLERRAIEARMRFSDEEWGQGEHHPGCYHHHLDCALRMYAADVRALVERVRTLEAGFDVTR